MIELIKELGGPAKLAKLLGIERTAVANWRQADRGIPWRFRPAVANLALKHGVTLPDDFWEPIKGVKP